MSSKRRTNLIIGITLLSCSVAIYGLKTAIVGDTTGTGKFLFNAMGVLPLNLLLMTFIFNKLLTVHTKQAQVQKRNMLIGVFFSECGNSILRTLARLDKNCAQLNYSTCKPELWENDGIDKIKKVFNGYEAKFDANREDLASIRSELNRDHRFLLSLMDNPAMVGHGKFTDLAWAIFHLEDELNHRPDFQSIPDSDMEHLSGDISRVYNFILDQWLNYMVYLKSDYPYLYSLALRTSPFKPEIDAVVQK